MRSLHVIVCAPLVAFRGTVTMTCPARKSNPEAKATVERLAVTHSKTLARSQPYILIRSR
jgi:hypothetical protein